jgi:hypothetical protein
MNGSGNGRCFVDKDGEHDTHYNIKEDENGNSPLTGEKCFTCVELEVY